MPIFRKKLFLWCRKFNFKWFVQKHKMQLKRNIDSILFGWKNSQ